MPLTINKKTGRAERRIGSVVLPVEIECSTCWGTGSLMLALNCKTAVVLSAVRCAECAGTGWKPATATDIDGREGN